MNTSLAARLKLPGSFLATTRCTLPEMDRSPACCRSTRTQGRSGTTPGTAHSSLQAKHRGRPSVQTGGQYENVGWIDGISRVHVCMLTWLHTANAARAETSRRLPRRKSRRTRVHPG